MNTQQRHEARKAQEALKVVTDDALVSRLESLAAAPRTWSAADRVALIREAAARVATKAAPCVSASRMVMGHCPSCGGVVVRLNNFEVWEPAQCKCGWGRDWDPTKPDLVNATRYERDFTVCTGEGGNIKVQLPPRRPVATVNVTSEVL